MIKNILLLCFLTITLSGKIINISSNDECFAYTHDNGKVEISCKGKNIALTDISISQNGAKGHLVGQSVFLEHEIRFSRNNKFVTVPSFGDPTKGAGINGTDKDNLYEILRVNTDTGKMDVIVRRKEKINISNFFDFVPEQMSGISSGNVIIYNHSVLDNGEVVFYADIVDFSQMSTTKRGYFSSNRYGEYYQIMTFAKTIRETPIYPEIFSYPTIDKDNNGFYYTLTEGGVGKLMYYKGLKRGSENTEVSNTTKSYDNEKMAVPTRILPFKDGIIWGNVYPSLFTIDDKGNLIFTSRYFNFNRSVSDILPTNWGIFATTRPFEEKDPFVNNSLDIVINKKPYNIVSSGQRVENKTIGVIGKNIHFVDGKIFFLSNGEILSKNVNIIQSIELKDGRVFIKGLFPDLNLERGIQILINGVVVVPEGTIPPSLRVNKNEISFNIPGNVSGKQKIEIIFSTIYGPVGAVNNGIEFEFPIIPVELNLFGENHREVAPGQEININVNSNVLGKFSITSEDANGIRPVNIISSGNSRNLNLNLKVLVNTKFTIKFISVNGEEKEISVFVEVMPPKISFLTSTREDQKIFSGDEVYVSGENLSPSGEESNGNNENLKVKINDIECDVIFISSSLLQIKVPDFEVVDEEENWLVLSVFGRETAIKIKINKKEKEIDPPMRK